LLFVESFQENWNMRTGVALCTSIFHLPVGAPTAHHAVPFLLPVGAPTAHHAVRFQLPMRTGVAHHTRPFLLLMRAPRAFFLVHTRSRDNHHLSSFVCLKVLNLRRNGCTLVWNFHSKMTGLFDGFGDHFLHEVFPWRSQFFLYYPGRIFDFWQISVTFRCTGHTRARSGSKLGKNRTCRENFRASLVRRGLIR
jgi:hypothetical protein